MNPGSERRRREIRSSGDAGAPGSTATPRRSAIGLAVLAPMLAAILVAPRATRGDEPAERVRAFEPEAGTRGSYPIDVASSGSSLWFHVTDGMGTLSALWVVDGPSGTPRIARDLASEFPYGMGWSYPAPVAVGDSLCFGGGQAIWRTDGGSPPEIVRRVATSRDVPQSVGAAGGRALFAWDDGLAGSELWGTDGTASGTVRVRDIRADGSSSPGRGVTVGSVLLFPATDATHGRELWRSDGTPEGTVIAADLRAGPNGSDPEVVGWIPGGAIVSGRDAGDVAVVWATDGTTSGTRVVVRSGASARHSFRQLGDAVLVLTFDAGRCTLRRTDGTGDGEGAGAVATTKVVRTWDHEQVWFLGDAHGLAYLVVTEPATGAELWRSDGTPVGTGLVTDLQPGASGSGPWGVVAAGPWAVFGATTAATGHEMWRTDGTAAGTSLLADIAPGAASGLPTGWFPNSYYFGMLRAAGGVAWFAAYDDAGMELWVTDGTPGGTRRAANIARDARGPSVTDIAASGPTLYLVADDAVHGREVWASDGTEPGTVAITDLDTPEARATVGELTDLGGALLFSAATRDGSSLRRADGTSTSIVATFPYDGMTGPPRRFTRAGDLVYLSVVDATAHTAWRTDGTPSGTVRLGGNQPWGFTAVGNDVFFRSRNGFNVWDLWSSDGTAAGTVRVADLRPPVEQTLLGAGVAFGGLYLFPCNATAPGSELWRSDGTAAGTRIDSDVWSGGSSLPDGLTVAGDRLFFAAMSGASRRDLFVRELDGAVAIVPATGPGGDATDPRPLGASGGTLWFSARSETEGRELWTSDGTAAGTALVRDIAPGPVSADPRNMLDVGGGRVVFVANDAAHGAELWTSDGTRDGTALVADVAPGTTSSHPKHLVLHDDHVWFAASADGLSTELWRVPVASLTALRGAADEPPPAPFAVPAPRGPEPPPPEAVPDPTDPPGPDEPGDLDLLTFSGTVSSFHVLAPLSGKLVVEGRLPAARSLDLEGVRIVVDVGGVRNEFVLDAGGRGVSSDGAHIRVRHQRPRRKTDPGRIRFRMETAPWASLEPLDDEDLVVGDGPRRVGREVLISAEWDARTWTSDAAVLCTRGRRSTSFRLR